MARKVNETSGVADLIARAGLFSVFLLVVFITTYFYSPVLGIHAEGDNGSVAGAWVESVASVSADAQVSLNITPTESGTFVSQPINVRAKSNTTAGYQLFMSSVDENTDMTSTASDDVISSDFSGTKTSSTIGANQWGYSLDNNEFSKIPKLSEQLAIVDRQTSVAHQETTHTVYIGAKVNSDLKSGIYTKNIIFSVVAYQLPKTIFDITYMQEMTGEVCSATTTPDNADPSNNYYPYEVTHVNTTDTSKIPETTLIDRRDNKSYIVRKYANGECWMAQNLELDFKTESDGFADDMTVDPTGGNTLANAVMTPVKSNTFSNEWIQDSDINDLNEFNSATNAIALNDFYATQSVPKAHSVNDKTRLVWANNGSDGAHSHSSDAAGLANYIVYNCVDNSQPCDDETNPHVTGGDGYYTFRESTTGEPYQRIGNYYNFAAATAGYLGTTTSTVQPNSICPRGWQLPGNSGERSFKNLIDTYYVTGEGKTYSNGASNTALYNWIGEAPLNFAKGGLYYRSNGGIWSRITYGYLWSSRNASSATHGNYFASYIDNGTTGAVHAQNSTYKGTGINIRCVARS